MWTLNKILPNNQQIKEEITRAMRKYFEINKNKNAKCQNLQDAAKVVLLGKFIPINACIKKVFKPPHQYPTPFILYHIILFQSLKLSLYVYVISPLIGT